MISSTFCVSGLRSRTSLAAENLFLSKRLGFYQKREVCLRIADFPGISHSPQTERRTCPYSLCGAPHAGVGQFSIGDPGSILHRRQQGPRIGLPDLLSASQRVPPSKLSSQSKKRGAAALIEAAWSTGPTSTAVTSDPLPRIACAVCTACSGSTSTSADP